MFYQCPPKIFQRIIASLYSLNSINNYSFCTFKPAYKKVVPSICILHCITKLSLRPSVRGILESKTKRFSHHNVKTSSLPTNYFYQHSVYFTHQNYPYKIFLITTYQILSNVTNNIYDKIFSKTPPNYNYFNNISEQGTFFFKLYHLAQHNLLAF